MCAVAPDDGLVMVLTSSQTSPFNVIVFILSLCLHMLSMYVWFCPHHDNPSLPAEGKHRCFDNAGLPVAPFLSLCVLSLWH